MSVLYGLECQIDRIILNLKKRTMQPIYYHCVSSSFYKQNRMTLCSNGKVTPLKITSQI